MTASIRTIVTASVLSLPFAFTGATDAQAQYGGGQQGGFGGQQGGFGGQQGGVGGQQGAFSNVAAPGGATGAQAFGGMGFGDPMATFGQQGGVGQTGGFGQQGGAGQAGVGAGGRNFVGRDSTEVLQNFQGQVGGQQGGRFGAGGQAIQNANDLRQQQGRWQQQQQNTNRQPLRIQLRPAFDLAVPVATEIIGGAQLRLNRSLEVEGAPPVEITIVEGRTVLRGVVASEYERAVVAQMAALEPGVAEIDNQLSVSEPVAAPPVAPNQP
jgi:hypothetical protein